MNKTKPKPPEENKPQSENLKYTPRYFCEGDPEDFYALEAVEGHKGFNEHLVGFFIRTVGVS